MVHIVHWRDVVGRDFLEQFITITRNIMFTEVNNRPYEDAFKKISLEVRHNYETKRDVMRFTGYQETRYGWRRHGWYTPYVERNEIKFHCTAPASERNYMTLGSFINWKQNYTASLIDPVEQDFIYEPSEEYRVAL